jgi:hypothetical protein
VSGCSEPHHCTLWPIAHCLQLDANRAALLLTNDELDEDDDYAEDGGEAAATRQATKARVRHFARAWAGSMGVWLLKSL